ncbi:MAG: arylsulfatase A-like enzyme [Gammaproteobacteria bacterium]|jgi:arylsulfatase A-like enzyme
MKILNYVVIALILSYPCFASAQQDITQPNILLIYVDDLGYGDLASYGHPVIKTPNLDALADKGLRLTNYYAPSALCSPSRAALLTGRHPYRTGIESWIPAGSGIYLHAEEVTLAEVLVSVGYQSALIGKWHLNSNLGSDTEPQPGNQGFGYFYGHNAFQIPSNRNPTNLFRNGKALEMQEGYTAQLYADEAIAWLSRRDKSKPFFLYLSMAEPHTAIENPAAFNEQYATFTNGPIIPITSTDGNIPKDKLVARGPGEYYANITYMDEQLGRVLQSLKDLSIDEETVIVFASDNGPVTANWINWWEVNAYGETGGLRGRKHFLYEGGIKVPAIIKYPGVTAPGSVSNELIVGTDFFATLAKIGGAEIPTDRPIDSLDIMPILAGGKMPSRSAFWALPSESELEFAVRQGEWKLLLDRNKKAKELYNLDEDPLEFFNLLNTHPAIAQQLIESFNQTLSSIEADPFKP